MSYSNEFKINVNKLNQDEALMILLEVRHPHLSDPIFLVRDSKDFLFNGNNYLAMNFSLRRQADIQGELPKVTIDIPNVGRSLVRWIDQSNGGANAVITVILARRSSSIIEEKIDFGINTVTINSETVSLSLIIQNNLVKKSMRWNYSIDRSPGIFG